MQIHVSVKINKDGYINDVHLFDSDGVISKPYRPLVLSIYEIERLYNKIKPIVEYNDRWREIHGKYMNVEHVSEQERKEAETKLRRAVANLAAEYPELTGNWIWHDVITEFEIGGIVGNPLVADKCKKCTRTRLYCMEHGENFPRCFSGERDASK